MDEEEEQVWPMPNGVLITSETMGLESLDPKPQPPGSPPQSELVLDLVVTERHTWHGVGDRIVRARRPKRLTREMRILSKSLDNSAAAAFCPGYLQDAEKCRRILGRVMRYYHTGEEGYRWLSPEHWDMAVPRDVERQIAAAAQGGDTTPDLRVRIGVDFEFVYSEPKALLRACGVGEDDGGLTGSRGGDGAAPSCPICFEEMSPEAEATTRLPGCTHGFHRSCVSEWLSKASTCPMCRRDMIQYLPPDYRELHDMMRPRHDILPG